MWLASSTVKVRRGFVILVLTYIQGKTPGPTPLNRCLRTGWYTLILHRSSKGDDMPTVSFAGLKPGHRYTIHDLAAHWGYADYHALARGVVTPRHQNVIILFMTEDKARWAKGAQYTDSTWGDYVLYEGPEDHFAEERMIRHETLGDQIHLFKRSRAGEPYTYEGELRFVDAERHRTSPTKFTFRMLRALLV